MSRCRVCRWTVINDDDITRRSDDIFWRIIKLLDDRLTVDNRSAYRLHSWWWQSCGDDCSWCVVWYLDFCHVTTFILCFIHERNTRYAYNIPYVRIIYSHITLLSLTLTFLWFLSLFLSFKLLGAPLGTYFALILTFFDWLIDWLAAALCRAYDVVVLLGFQFTLLFSSVWL